MLNFVICDDNENSLSKFSKMLNLVFENNNLEGHITLSSPNPYDVLEYVSKHTVDAVILDIDLQSDISGLDLAQKIREISKNIYIILWSSFRWWWWWSLSRGQCEAQEAERLSSSAEPPCQCFCGGALWRWMSCMSQGKT